MNAPTRQDEGTAPEQGSKRFRRRWLAIAAAIMGIVAVLILRERFRKDPTIDYPIEPPGGEPVFTTYPWWSGYGSGIRIAGVSADGRWIALEANPMRKATRVYFDVAQKRFAGNLLYEQASDPSTNIFSTGGPHWMPESIVVAAMRVKQGASDRLLGRLLDRFNIHLAGASQRLRVDAAYHVVNAPEGKIRFLAEIDQTENLRAGSCAILSRDGARLLYSVYTGPRYSVNSAPRFANHEYRIRDLRNDTEQAVTPRDLELGAGDHLRVWDWLPDNRTAVFIADNGDPDRYSLRSLHLVDANGREPPRHFPIAQWFQVKRFARALAADKTGATADHPAFIALLGFFGEPPRARFAVRFQTGPHSTDPSTDRSSIWDLDPETGRMLNVADLPLGIGRHAAVLVSPSGDRLLTAPGFMTITGDRATSRISPVLYEIDGSPRHPPLRIHWTPHIDALVREFSYFKFPKVRFLDDNTLIYIEEDDEIRRLDLRTGQSESLGTVERKRLARNGAW